MGREASIYSLTDLCLSAGVNLTVMRSLILRGFPDIGQTVFVEGATISVAAAPGVYDGIQNAGIFWTCSTKEG